MLPDPSAGQHFKLPPPQHAALRRLGIQKIRDLLYHFPTRYEAAGASGQVSGLVPGTKVTLFGTLSKLKAKKLWKSRRPATEGWFEDGTGRVKVMWFNQPYMASYVPQDKPIKVTGTVGGSVERPYITNPEVEAVPAGIVPEGIFADAHIPNGAPRIFPVYPESRGITSLWFFHALERIFTSSAHAALVDPIPEDVRERYHLPDLAEALVYIHTPEKQAHAEAARKRFAFEEILSIQIARAQERRENDVQTSFPIHDSAALAQKFLATVPFPPTKAQNRAIADILNDFSAGGGSASG